MFVTIFYAFASETAAIFTLSTHSVTDSQQNFNAAFYDVNNATRSPAKSRLISLSGYLLRKSR
jgi:hypothetical protein